MADSQWDDSKTLPPMGVVGTSTTIPDEPARNEGGARKERRGSLEKKYQPDFLYPYASKLDKINSKREEELKLATTLLGEMADRVLSEQNRPSSSPERRAQPEVSDRVCIYI